jgi:NitT/TauT family transport system permease protein
VVLAWQIAVGAIAIAAWQTLVTLGLLDAFFVSRPSDIAKRLSTWVVSGSLWGHLATTLEESLLGLTVGAALGISLGFGFARSPMVARVFDPYIKMLNAVPRVVLAPLFLLWFGLGIWSKVALAVTLVFFVMFFNTYQGVRDADKVLIDNVRMLGASERQLVRPRAHPERADLDLLQPSDEPRIRDGRARLWESIWARRAVWATSSPRPREHSTRRASLPA